MKRIASQSLQDAAAGGNSRRRSVPGTEIAEVTVRTAHSFASSVISRNHGKLNLLSDKMAEALLKKAVRSVRRDIKKGQLWSEKAQSLRRQRSTQLEELEEGRLKLVLRLFEYMKASKSKLVNALERFDELSAYRIVLSEVRSRYRAQKEKAGRLDYGDMLVRASKILSRDDGAAPCRYLLVDEYQDCSPAQVHLLACVAGLPNRRIMVFGDPDQAIFGFSGARYTRLASVLDGVEELPLSKSRRLTEQNAALASAVAQYGPEQSIRTTRSGVRPVLQLDRTLRAQTQSVVASIGDLIEENVPPASICVLARHKALLRYVEQLLLARQVATHRLRVKRRRTHPIRVLRLVSIVERCAENGIKVTPTMLRRGLRKMAAITGDRWASVAKALNTACKAPTLEGRYIQCSKAYLRLLGGSHANKEVRDDINRWIPICRDHRNALAMRNTIKLMEPTGVTTGTIHAAKGGEWEHVFVVGVTDGLLPDYRAKDNLSLVEERNLLFVAITRARSSVRLYHSPYGDAQSRQRFISCSRYADEPAVRKSLKVINNRQVRE